MKCKLCGYDIEPGKDICSNCGTKVDSNDSWDLVNNNNIVFEENNSVISTDPKIIEPTAIKEPVYQEVTKKTTSEKKSNKYLIIGLSFISIVLAIIIGFIFYFQIFTNSKGVFNDAIDKIFDFALKPVNDNSATTSGSISFDADITTPSNSELINIINKLDLSLDFDIDYINEIVKANGKLQYDNSDIKGSLYAYDNNIYLYSNELYDKYIRYPFEYKKLLTSNGEYISDYTDIVKEFKKALVLSLKDDYFTNYKTTVNIKQQEINVDCHELIVNKDNVKDIKKNIYTYLYNSSKFIKSVSSLSKQDEEKIKENINSTLDSIAKEEINDGINLVIDIYTKGFMKSFVGVNINYNNDNINVLKEKDNIYVLSLNMNGKTINTNITINKVNNKTMYIIDYSDGTNQIKLNIGFEMYHHKRITKVDVNNYIDYDKLSDQDSNNIRVKLEGNEAIGNLQRDLENMNNQDLDINEQINSFNILK